MGIGRYIVFSIVFLVAIGFFVLNSVSGNYVIELFGFSMMLPIVVWVLIPPVLLLLATVLHLSAYSMKGFMKERALKKDYETFVKGAVKKILGEKVVLKAKSSYFETPMKLLNSLENTPAEEIETFKEEALQKAFGYAKEIRSGKYIDVKELKMSKESKLFVLNQENRLKLDTGYASEVLRNCVDKTSQVCQDAFLALCATATSLKEIRRYEYPITQTELNVLLSRVESGLMLSDAELFELLDGAGLDKLGYIACAKILKNKISPDRAVSLFLKLYEAHMEIADDAYLYLLYDLQMHDAVKEILINAQEDEYQLFRALLDLKTIGKHYDIDTFM